MRFVPVKSQEQQANGVVFRARDLLVRQRTQIINGLRGHLAEYGCVAPKGIGYVERLLAEIEEPTSELPEAARTSLQVLAQHPTTRPSPPHIRTCAEGGVHRWKSDLRPQEFGFQNFASMISAHSRT